MSETIELVLRVAAMAQLAFFAVLIARDAGRTLTGGLAVGFLGAVIAYLVCGTFGHGQATPWWHYPVYAGCFSVPAIFWLFSRALFEDGFRLRPWHALLVAAVLAISFVVRFSGLDAAGSEVALGGLGRIVRVLPQLIGLALVVSALVLAFRGRAADLVETRRRFRDLLVGTTGAYMLLVVAVEILFAAGPAPALANLLNVGAIYALTFGFTLAAARLHPGALIATRRAPVGTDDLSASERALLERLRAAIDEDRVFEQPGLTIGALAERLDTQEHRLRRLINRGLGFRNFNEFLNRHRIAAARARLIDPTAAELPVLTIAMDLGYNSLGPFNRAFREATGMSPSEYRRAGGGPDGTPLDRDADGQG